MANHLDLRRDEANEVILLQKKAPSGEWRSASQGRIERWSLAVGVMDNDGNHAKGLAIELECLRTAKPYRESFKFGLFRSEFGAPKRAYQLDTTSTPIGMPGSHDWPHEHFGQDRTCFGEDNFPTTFEEALEYFKTAVNIEFDEPLESPFEFKLRSQR
jgi:hypothetical protein